MMLLGLLLMGVGGLVAFVFSVIILVIAFKKGLLWGLGSLFVPLVVLVFIAMHWQETKKPFLYSLASSVVMFIGIVLAGLGGMDMSQLQ